MSDHPLSPERRAILLTSGAVIVGFLLTVAFIIAPPWKSLLEWEGMRGSIDEISAHAALKRPHLAASSQQPQQK